MALHVEADQYTGPSYSATVCLSVVSGTTNAGNKAGGLFQQTIQFFTTDQCEKRSCPSSLRRRDSNPRPQGMSHLP